MPIALSLNPRLPSIRITGPIDMALALSLLDEIKLLRDYYQFRIIELQINSPGGDAEALHFLVEQLAPWRKGEDRILRTLGIGEVASAAALLLSLGTKGHRAALRHSRLLYHPARVMYANGTAQTSDQLRAASRRMDRWNDAFMDLIVEHTGGDRRKLTKLFRMETFIGPEKAIELGLIDKIEEGL